MLVDAYSKWPEVYSVPIHLISSVIKILQGLFTRYGTPKILVSDNGPQFTSSEFQRFLKQHAVVHKTSAPFHSAMNGQAERYVGTIKAALRISDTASPTVPLLQKLNRFLLVYR